MNNEKLIKPNYDYAMQHLYIEMFLADAVTFIRCQNIFDHENFDQRLQKSAEFLKQYVDVYKVVPEVEIINAACSANFASLSLPEENYEWLMNEFENFSRHKGLERAIIESSDLLEAGDYGPVEKLIRDAIQISLTKDMGTDYFEDPRARLAALKDGNGQLSTGWPSVDRRLYGGFNRGELNIFCAGCVVGDTEIKIVRLIDLKNFD